MHIARLSITSATCLSLFATPSISWNPKISAHLTKPGFFSRSFAFTSSYTYRRRSGSYGKISMAATSLKIACIQLACGKDKKANIKSAEDKIGEAARAGANLIVLPECFNSPYGTKYFNEYAESVITGESETAEMLSRAARANSVFLIGGSFPEREGDKMYNSCYAFNRDGDMVARHRKVLPSLPRVICS